MLLVLDLIHQLHIIRVATNTQRTINIQLTIPAGYYNAGQQTSPQDVIVTQPPATFTMGDWTGDVSIDKYGSINYSLGNATSFATSPTSFAEVASSTSRLISSYDWNTIITKRIH